MYQFALLHRSKEYGEAEILIKEWAKVQKQHVDFASLLEFCENYLVLS